MGYSSKDPDESIINNPSQSDNQLESDNYFYGEKTAKLFKKFKKIKRLMEKEGFVLPDDLRGVYVETIFTQKIETMIVYDKSKKLKRFFTFDKEKKIFYFKMLDNDDKILNEKNYKYNEIIPENDDKIKSEKKINIMKISLKKITHEKDDFCININNIKDENISLDTDRTLNKTLDFEFQEDNNNLNDYTIEKKQSLFCWKNRYSIVINSYEFIFSFGSCLSGFNCRNRCMEIKYKNKSESNETEKNYGFISKNGKCCLDNFNFDFYFENNIETKYANLSKKINFFCQNSIIEINNNLSEQFSIKENGCCHNKSHEIYKRNNIIGNMVQNSRKDGFFYEVGFNFGNLDFKDKITIIIGLILIIN